MMNIMRLGTRARRLAFAVMCAVLTLAPNAVAGTEGYSYDALGRVTAVTHAGGSTESYSYDNAGNRSQSVIVVPAPTVSLSANPTSVVSGNAATLSWSSLNATSATIDNGVGAVSPASGGSVSVSPTSTTTYAVTVTGGGGTATASATVGVVSATFTASAETITVGNSVVLSWKTANAASVSIDNGIGTVSPVSDGSVTVSPSADTTYTLTATNAAGASVTYTVKVSVVAAPSGSLSASPAIITSGSSATLSWAVSNATSATLNGASISPSNGSASVNPTSTTSYTLVVTNAAGTTASYSVTVTVVAAPSGSISVASSLINNGSSTALSWTASNATSATINNASVSSSGGSMTVSPTSSTTYTLIVTNAAGTSASYSVSVTVNNLPSVVADSVSTNEDTSVSISPLSNDSDADGNTLSISAVGTPSHGSVSLSGTVITYTPQSNYNGTDTFSYTVSDGIGTSTGNVVVTINPVNDIPTATTAYVGVAMGKTITVDISKYVTDVDGDTITFKSATSTSVNFSCTLSGSVVTIVGKSIGGGSCVYSFTDGTKVSGNTIYISNAVIVTVGSN